MLYIDSHTHITNQEHDLDRYRKEIAQAKSEGLIKSLLVLTEKDEEALYPKLKDDNYFSFARGIFPTDTAAYRDQDLKELEDFLKNEGVVALGEIGLDYHWAKDIADKQKELFIKQLHLADRIGLPVIIHSREAMNDTYEILKGHANRKKGVIHCFSGSKEMAEKFIELGYYISFSGTLTYAGNKQGVRTLEAIDLDYLLCETDAPYLTPVPLRGQNNKTQNVKYVYAFISEHLNIPLQELTLKVKANYERLFGAIS